MKLPRGVPVTAGRPFIELAPEMLTAILRTVEAGWALALKSPDVNAGAAEVPMTERLRDGMRSALNGGELPWGRTMVVLPGTESRSRPDVLLPDGRTDIPILLIRIFLRFGEHDPHAIIECKRIAGDDTHLCREYVVNGIDDRFRTGKYAGNHATGFMAGYLIADHISAAVAGINNYLHGKKRDDEHLTQSNLIDEPWVRGSRHPRSDTVPIVMHHAFLKTEPAQS